MKRPPSSLLRTAGLAGAAALLLAAGSVVAPSAASVGPASRATIHQTAGGVRPNTCGANKTETIKIAGGKFMIPPCGGTKGSVTYGANNAPSGATVTLLSSQTNPAPSSCGSTSGETALAYVLATGNGVGSVSYGTTTKKSTLKNPAFPQSATFTLIAYAFGVEQFAESIGSPNANGVLKFASPLNGMNLPLGLTFCFELDTP